MNLYFQTWGVRKLTVVDNGFVDTSDLVKQSLYIDRDLGVPRATAMIPHLKERCPAVVRISFLISYAFFRFVLLTCVNDYCHIGGCRHQYGYTSAWASCISQQNSKFA
jgi:hypothetical protein